MVDKRTFVAADYAVFAVMLAISTAIGIYFGYQNKKAKSGTFGYLLANRSMTVIPVALSLVTSFNSSLSLLTIPAEVYTYGTMILWIELLYIIMAILTSEIFLPTFYRLGISSTYEYLEMRFNRVVRIFGTLTFIVATIFYMGIVMYGPSLAFGAVTDFQLWSSILITGVVCTFYTMVGGLKGVIWTDVFQAIVMFTGIVAVLIKGSLVLGGFGNVWRIAEESGRIDFVHFETDIRIRNTVWSIVVGGIIRWTGMYGVSQSQVQRYLCCKTEKQAKRSIFLNLIGLLILPILVGMCGLLLYAYYRGCDPLMGKCIQKSDQLMPYMVLEIFEDYPGAAGLFISAVYAASMSSVSSGINAMATVTLEDLIKPWTNLEDKKYNWISKGLVLFFGLLSIGMAFLLSTTKELLQATLSLMGLLMGPLVGLFLLAIQFPFVNWMGALSGLLTGLGAGVWFYFGRKSIKKSNAFIRRLPLSVDMCTSACSRTVSEISNFTLFTSFDANSTYMTTPYMEEGSTFISTTSAMLPPVANSDDDIPFYTISFHYISCIGLIVTMVIGVIVSLATCGWRQRKNVEQRLLRPPFDHWMFRRWLPEKVRWFLRFGINWKDNDVVKSDSIQMKETAPKIATEVEEEMEA